MLPQSSIQIKEAFSKVKGDITSLKSQINSLNEEIHEIKETLEILKSLLNTSPLLQAKASLNQTQNQTDQTLRQIQTDTQADKQSQYGLKTQNNNISIGNDGVQADNQADRQTIRQTDKHSQKFAQFNNILSQESQEINQDQITKIEKVAEILDSLDTLKKTLRAQFKKLTNQEMLIFSTIYQLSDQGFSVDYPLLAAKTNLSESAVRDYTQKIIKKGIPLGKIKENNKKVSLSIPPEFKRMASLETILSLREI